MNAIGSRSNTLLLWLVAFAAVAAVIAWEADWGRGLTRAPEIPAAAAPAPVALALLPDFKVEGGLAERQQTVERPVFVPTRRPAPPPPAQEAAKPRIQRGQFQLTGTAVVDQKSVAFLREAAGGKARTVRVGETINGLLVAEVKPDRVKLTLGDESEELVLKVAAGPRTTVQPVQAAAAAPAAPLPGQPGGPPVAGAVPTAAAPGGATAGQPPAAQSAADAEASLLERRRAARAAQAAAESAARTGQAVPPALPSPPATTAPAATPSTPDPAWAEVYRRMQQPRR